MSLWEYFEHKAQLEQHLRQSLNLCCNNSTCSTRLSAFAELVLVVMWPCMTFVIDGVAF